MRRLSRLAFVMALVLTSVAVTIGPATACPPGEVPAPGGGGEICIPAVDPGDDGDGGDGSGPGSGQGGGGTPQPPDPTGCFLTYIDPQPDANNPTWGGHTPDEGSLYYRRCHLGGDPQGDAVVFVPDGEEPPPPDPDDLARKALDEMPLKNPNVHLAPAPPDQTYVGLDTWLWMPPGQWTNLEKSVTAGDTTVTVTAVPKSVLWNMGPSSTTCHSPGREWKFGQMPKGSETDCSYKYTKISDFEPDKKFKVASTITYQVDWTCDGDCLVDAGDLGPVPGPAGGAAISVGERQSVVVSGGRK